MAPEFFKGNYNNFSYNPYNNLRYYAQNGQGIVSDSSIVKARAQAQQQQASPALFKFSEGKNLDEYRAGALSAAQSFIADGDTKDASGKGDGKLTKEEYIAMQKAKTQKLDAQTGGVMEGAQWDDEIHPQLHGAVFDAINTQRSTNGSPETIDAKEVAAYFSFVDASDDNMDGKIQFGTAHGMEEILADTDNPKSSEKASQLKDWYGNLF